MAEKMLFQIAVERIVDRIAKLPKEKGDQIIKIINDFMTVDCGDHYTEEAKKKVFEILFPELLHNKRSTDHPHG